MSKKRKGGPPADVGLLRVRFDRWRSGKQGQERIPTKLWEAAAALCGDYSVHKVSRWLRLNHTALQERARRRPRRRPLPRRPAFVEWRVPAGAIAGGTPTEYVVEVGASGADRIRALGASVSEVAALARALREAGS